MSLKLNIRTKYILSISLLVIVTSLILIYFFITEQTKIHTKNQEKKATDLIRNLSFNASSFTMELSTSNATILNKLLLGILKEENVIYAGIISNEQFKKVLILESNFELTNKKIIPAYLLRIINEDEFQTSDFITNTYTLPKGLLPESYAKKPFKILSVISPIYDQNSNKKIMAYAIIGISLYNIEQTIQHSINMSFMITFYVILIGILMAILLTNTITRPIHKLVIATQKIAAGDYTYHALIHSADEIGQLANSFNLMTSKIKSAQEQLAKYNRQLEEKVLERTKELSIALKKATESDRLKTEFMTNMSHELRTPLNAIIGFSDILLQGMDGEITEEQKHDIFLIHHSGQHLLTLINGILDISKIETDTMELNQESIDLSSLANEVLSIIKGLLKGKPITLKLSIPKSLSPLKADKVKLKQILLNLLSNAVKFTLKGQVELIIQQEDKNTLFEIKDTGIGIKKEDLSKIFGRFRQIDGTTTRNYQGIGIGLNLAAELIKMHKGKIWVKSTPQKGTSFFFTIPQ